MDMTCDAFLPILVWLMPLDAPCAERSLAWSITPSLHSKPSTPYIETASKTHLSLQQVSGAAGVGRPGSGRCRLGTAAIDRAQSAVLSGGVAWAFNQKPNSNTYGAGNATRAATQKKNVTVCARTRVHVRVRG